MKQRPSDLFIEAILRGYRSETQRPVTPSAIWTQICGWAMPQTGMFSRLFDWDVRKSHQNRIGTLREVIKAGYVPGLTIEQDARGMEIVCEVRP